MNTEEILFLNDVYSNSSYIVKLNQHEILTNNILIDQEYVLTRLDVEIKRYDEQPRNKYMESVI